MEIERQAVVSCYMVMGVIKLLIYFCDYHLSGIDIYVFPSENGPAVESCGATANAMLLQSIEILVAMARAHFAKYKER